MATIAYATNPASVIPITIIDIIFPALIPESSGRVIKLNAPNIPSATRKQKEKIDKVIFCVVMLIVLVNFLSVLICCCLEC